LTEKTPTSPNRVTVKWLAKLAEDDRGATAVEYALMLAGVTALIIISVFLFGGKVNGLLEKGLW
jgi:Flp pilus assembly pilin Flp